MNAFPFIPINTPTACKPLPTGMQDYVAVNMKVAKQYRINEVDFRKLLAVPKTLSLYSQELLITKCKDLLHMIMPSSNI